MFLRHQQSHHQPKLRHANSRLKFVHPDTSTIILIHPSKLFDSTHQFATCTLRCPFKSSLLFRRFIKSWSICYSGHTFLFEQCPKLSTTLNNFCQLFTTIILPSCLLSTSKDGYHVDAFYHFYIEKYPIMLQLCDGELSISWKSNMLISQLYWLIYFPKPGPASHHSSRWLHAHVIIILCFLSLRHRCEIASASSSLNVTWISGGLGCGTFEPITYQIYCLLISPWLPQAYMHACIVRCHVWYKSFAINNQIIPVWVCLP